MARKRELGYVLNKYKDLYYDDSNDRYFPETFLIPEQLDEYKRTHKVDGFQHRNTRTGFTSAKPTEAVKEPASRCSSTLRICSTTRI